MENFLSLLESIDPSWLTPSSTTWAMDMFFAFVCGVGLFHVLLCLLPLDSPSPPPAENTTPQKVVCREHRKVRKKIRTVKAYRSTRKKPKEDKVLGSLLHSMQERLLDIINICRRLGEDASGEACKPDAAKAHLPPRQPTGESVATNSSLVTSYAPSNEHLLCKDSKPMSPVLLNSLPTESQSSVSASWPPETLTTGRRHSAAQQRAPSHPSHPLDPVVSPPPMPDPSMAAPHFGWKILATSQVPTLPGLPRPVPTTPGTNLSKRPTSVTPGLIYSSRSTSNSIDLDHISRPTSTTQGLDHLIRPTSTTLGLNYFSRSTSTSLDLGHVSRPTSTSPGLNYSSRSTSTSLDLDHVSRPTSTTLGLNYSSTSTSTSIDLDCLSRPTSTSPGLNYSSRSTSTSVDLD